MCDAGMMTYKRFHEDRILTGRVRSGGKIAEVSRDAAVEAAAAVLEKVPKGKLAVVLSAQHSSEDNYVLAKLAREHFETDRLYLTALGGWRGDSILRHPDNNPNRAGAKAVAGGELGTMERLVADIEAGHVQAVLSLGWATSLTEAQLAPLANLEGVGTAAHVNLTTNAGPLTSTASVVVPVASVAETSGTFVNAKGMAQSFRRAVRAPGGIKSGWETLVEIGRRLGWEIDFRRLGDVQRAMPHKLPATAQAAEEQPLSAT
jgi:NADH-quinone oxidoreductase subunit G